MVLPVGFSELSIGSAAFITLFKKASLALNMDVSFAFPLDIRVAGEDEPGRLGTILGFLWQGKERSYAQDRTVAWKHHVHLVLVFFKPAYRRLSG